MLTVAVDFHGVIVAHPEGSQGATRPDWPEVPGAVEWLAAVSARYAVVIVSARFARPGREGAEAVAAARAWLAGRGVPHAWLVPGPDGEPARITLSAWKPACVLWVDDRAFCFAGRFPAPDEIQSFRPWNR